ncbi:hypothetical protein BDQ17DRAFT_955058 [Cyathus striatus]|nr:hypothetical protein BDQ17DRAFT_955058 [Cyathus striatus]
MYWGAVYDFNGRRVGSAYAERGGKDDVVMVHKVKQRRLFIGNIQASWGLSDRAVIKDEELPVPTMEASKSRRVYIGNPKKLFLPLKVDTEHENDSDDISSLTSLEDSEAECEENKNGEVKICMERSFVPGVLAPF